MPEESNSIHGALHSPPIHFNVFVSDFHFFHVYVFCAEISK